jgi:hypothetical protein
MAIDVSAVTEQVWNAMRGGLTQLGPAELTVAKQQAAILAQALADIEAARLANSITDAQASDLVSAQASAADGVLQTQLGVAELAANGAIKAGLGVLLDVALGAVGLGWAAPIIQGVIGSYAGGQ